MGKYQQHLQTVPMIDLLMALGPEGNEKTTRGRFPSQGLMRLPEEKTWCACTMIDCGTGRFCSKKTSVFFGMCVCLSPSFCVFVLSILECFLHIFWSFLDSGSDC